MTSEPPTVTSAPAQETEHTFWPIGPRTLAEFQGHHLLAAKLAARLGVVHRGWSGSLSEKVILKMCRSFFGLRGLDPETAWGLLIGNFLTRHGTRGRNRVHWIWGDNLPAHVTHREAALFTIHQPMELWSEATRADLAKCGGVITMAQRECDWLRATFPHLKSAFIPHGVDTEFWRPAPEMVQDRPRQICVIGRYLRNFDMLTQVSSALLRSEPDLVIHWLVNPDFAVDPRLAATLPAERFSLVRNLSATELRAMYQRSWLFFTPYENVTASNAIVEAMACGVPIFTTRVGGMESYVENAGVLVPNNANERMISVIRECLASRSRREELSKAAREVALRRFSWPTVVEQHIAFYRSLDVVGNA